MRREGKNIFPNRWRNFREQLGCNGREIAELLGIDTPQYSVYESGRTIPVMRRFTQMKLSLFEHGIDLPDNIYFYTEYPIDSLPLLREGKEPVEVSSLIELRKELDLSLGDFSTILKGRYDDRTFWRWESGATEMLVDPGVVMDRLARKNNIRCIEDKVWSKYQNKIIYMDWDKNNPSFKIGTIKRRLEPLTERESSGRRSNDLVKSGWKDNEKIGKDGRTPIDLLRIKMGLKKSELGELLGLSNRTIGILCAGDKLLGVPMAKFLQEEARQRGIAVTLDELYQNVECYRIVEGHSRI